MTRRKTPKWKKGIRKFKKNFSKYLSLKDLTLVFVLIFGWINMFLPASVTNSYFSDTETASGEISVGIWGTETSPTPTPSPSLSPSPTPVPGKIVINEFLPNPGGLIFGDDADAKPKGEWVELYNTSSALIDLAGYYLTDADDNRIDVETCRTNSGSIMINSGGFLVVYRRGGDTCTSHNFSLNNDGDTVNLHNSSGEIIDFYTYSIDVLENKSFARIPDGSDNWVDPYPTPGGPNRLEEQPIVEALTGFSLVSSTALDLKLPETTIEIIETSASDSMPAPIPTPEIVQEPSVTPEPVVEELPVTQEPPASQETVVQVLESVVLAEPVNIEPPAEPAPPPAEPPPPDPSPIE